MKAILILITFCLVSGCGEDKFPKYIELGGLRVLAIRAELASDASITEFSPGDTVRIKPYVSDYRGGARTLSYEAVACPDPGVSYGAEPDCGALAVPIASGALTISGAIERSGAANEFTATIPSAVLQGRKPSEQYNGLSLLVVYKLTASDGASVKSFKRILASTRTPKGRNPTLTGLTANGNAISAWPAGEVELAGTFSPSDAETYTTMRTDGGIETRTETLTTTYFITDGSLKYFRTTGAQATTYTANGTRPTDHTPVVIAVLRDDRGGVSVRVQSL